MRRGALRSLAVMACSAWVTSAVSCDPPRAATRSTFVDTDGDGLSDTDEIAIYGTSPILKDTDGDGITDYEEVINHAFNADTQPLLYNPRVADVPEMVVQLAGPPLLTLNLTTTEGETWSWDVSNTIENTIAWTLGTSEEVGFSNTVGGSDTVSREIQAQFGDNSVSLAETEQDAGTDGQGDGSRNRNDNANRNRNRNDAHRNANANANANPNPNNAFGNFGTFGNVPFVPQRPILFDTGGPTPVTLTSAVSSTVDWSNTSALTLTFSAEQTRQLRQAVTFAQGYAVNHQISASGADLLVLVDLYNTGTMPFTVMDFLMSASMIGPRGEQIPVGNLYINTNLTAYVPFSIAPGGHQGPFNCARLTLSLEQFAMLGDLSRLKVNVGQYDLLDVFGKSFVFRVPEITARTATVDVDYGGKRPHERYYVATNLNPAAPGVTLRRTLEEILRMPFEAEPERGLTSLRNVATTDPGRWTVELRHSEGGEPVTTAFLPPYDLREILLRAGDVVHIRWATP